MSTRITSWRKMRLTWCLAGTAKVLRSFSQRRNSNPKARSGSGCRRCIGPMNCSEPTRTAVDGLEWALELAPYDANLRMMVASRQMQDKRFAEAIRTITPLAFNPHAGADNPAIALLETARQALAAQSGGAA